MGLCTVENRWAFDNLMHMADEVRFAGRLRNPSLRRFVASQAIDVNAVHGPAQRFAHLNCLRKTQPSEGDQRDLRRIDGRAVVTQMEGVFR